jgi:hypothetical protein
VEIFTVEMDRRTNKKKLSKHLLEMKFMKRTREKTELQVAVTQAYRYQI